MAAKGVSPGRVAAARIGKKITAATGKRDKAKEALDAAQAVLEALYDELAWVEVPPGQIDFPPNNPVPDLLEGLEQVCAPVAEPEVDDAEPVAED